MYSVEPLVDPKSDYYLYQPSAVASQVYLYPIVMGHFYYKAGYTLTRKQYPSFLLLYLTNGSCSFGTGPCLSNESNLTACRNQFVFLDCYQPHTYTFTEDTETYWIHFDGPLARTFFRLITGGNGTVLTVRYAYPLVQLMQDILRQFQENTAIHEAVLSEQITKLLTYLLNSRTNDTLRDSTEQVVSNTLAFVNEHFRERLSLEDLARNAHLSPYYFTRIFTEETGYTPHQYLIATRLNSAKFLLLNTELSVKDIAFSSGFHSETGFCNTFKKWEGMTPSVYRQPKPAPSD